MSDIAATSIGLVEETTPGVTPATPVFELQNITDDTIDATATSFENTDLRTDLNTTGVTPTGTAPGGGYPFNFRFNGLKQPLRGVLGANYAMQPARANRVTAFIQAVAAGSPGTYTVDASNGVEDCTGTFLPGHLVLAEGFTNTANNGLKVAAAGTTSTAVNATGLATEVPGVGPASLHAVGFEFASGDLVAVGSGGASAGYVGALTSTARDFTTLGVQPGDIWKLGSGAATAAHRFATAANNGYVVIGKVSANRLDLLEVPAGWASDTGAGKTLWAFFGDTLTNGVLLKTFTVEETYSDLGPEYTYTRGMLPNSVALSIPQSAPITGTVGFLGMVQDDPTLTRLAGATSRAAATGQVLHGANTLSELRISGATASGATFVTQMDVTFERFEAERRGGLFVYGAAGVSLKRFRATGSFQMYYESTTGRQIRAAAKAATVFPVSLMLVDPQGPSGTRAHGLYLPHVQYTGAPRQNRNGSRAMNAGWNASVHDTLGFTARWTRFWYIET